MVLDDVTGRHKSKVDTFVMLYLLGDVYQVPMLRNAVMRALFDHLNYRESIFPYYGTCNLVFEKLPAEDPFCRLLVDHACRKKSSFTTALTELNATFLFELANRWVRVVYEEPKIDPLNHKLRIQDYLIEGED
ncbi:hypothetical protein P171DRAFT_480312 [Karstenula rhodostoma CBS 690.94]|uniref:Uncharacterized protein n=1 Tax=Karstenula rhodostoma CBS 690.94 TaxID=1392251 RepID=A0A9P4PS17_9PLEO|nr:hypothetical protein P171DRAFT_480312 [Karstenula rhodostoma CBS 690.94]